MIDLGAYMRFRSRFQEALDERLYPLAYLDHLILSGAVQFLATDEAAIIFEVKTYPSGLKDVHGVVAAGDIGVIVEELIPQAEGWGRENGCAGASIASRPGWARELKSKGYEPLQLTVRKEL